MDFLLFETIRERRQKRFTCFKLFLLKCAEIFTSHKVFSPGSDIPYNREKKELLMVMFFQATTLMWESIVGISFSNLFNGLRLHA